MAELSGGEVLARMLQAEGVEKVFGIIDGTYFGFYSNLHKLGIEIVTPRHETCAAHMAGAYARLTGKLGVCMASNGPASRTCCPAWSSRMRKAIACLRSRVAAGRRSSIPIAAAPTRRSTRSARSEVLQVEPVRSSRSTGRGTRAHRAAPLLGRPAGRRAPRRAGNDHERQVQADVAIWQPRSSGARIRSRPRRPGAQAADLLACAARRSSMPAAA